MKLLLSISITVFLSDRQLIILGKEKYDICDEEIFEGKSCYEIDSLTYCPECMKIRIKVIGVSVISRS